MTDISKAATGVIKYLANKNAPQKTRGVTRFFRKIFSGKTKPPAPRFQAPKDQFVKSQVENVAAIKADQAYFKNAATHNKKELVKEVRALRKELSPVNVPGQAVKPQSRPSPVHRNVKVQPLEASQPVYKNGVNTQSGLPKDWDDRLTRLYGRDPGKTLAQEQVELENRLTRLYGVDPGKTLTQQEAELNIRFVNLDRSLKEIADLKKAKHLSNTGKITPAQRSKALKLMQQTRQKIMADPQLSKLEKDKKWEEAKKIWKEFT